jgi:hypothetical protein
MIPLFLSEHQEYLNAFPSNQLQALAYLSIKAHGYGFGNGLLFFGSTLLIEGYLFRKSGYFPKTLGVLLQIAGVCYLANSFTLILDPELAGKLFPAILMPALVAELSTSLWLAIKGVNITAWNARGATIHG